MTDALSAPMTARARARAELTREILASARRQLAEVGAASLSVRAVARDLGMASSAVYRYFASRDDLLTALIIEAFDAVGAAAEAAATTRGDTGARFVAVAGAVRAWAVAHPHDYALVYGSPVPGYAAPRDTVPAAARVSLAALRVIADGVAAGEVATTSTAAAVPPAVHADLARLRDASGLDLPDEVLSRALIGWTALFGVVSYELFGHLHGVVEDADRYFDHHIRRVAAFVVTGQG